MYVSPASLTAPRMVGGVKAVSQDHFPVCVLLPRSLRGALLCASCGDLVSKASDFHLSTLSIRTTSC